MLKMKYHGMLENILKFVILLVSHCLSTYMYTFRGLPGFLLIILFATVSVSELLAFQSVFFSSKVRMFFPFYLLSLFLSSHILALFEITISVTSIKIEVH